MEHVEAPTVRDFVSKYLDVRRGHPTAILHIGDSDRKGSVRSIFVDPTWTYTSVGSPPGANVTSENGKSARPPVAPRSFDAVISTEPLASSDFPWVSALGLARALRPGGLACIALSSQGQGGTSVDRWQSPLDDTLGLVEWADLESLGLLVATNPNEWPGPMVVARRANLPLHRELLSRLKMFGLRALSARQARRRAAHLGIRRGQRRTEAHRLLSPSAGRAQTTSRARAAYKETWQHVSGDAETAKTSVAGHTDESLFQFTADQTVRVLRETTGLRRDDVVLEIGAGVGRVGPAIAPLVRRWIATDVSSNMLEQARERCAGLDNVEFVEISGWDLAPISDASVDVVYCTIVFPHLDEWDRFSYTQEAMRVLRPGGRLYVDNVNLLSDPGWTFFTEMLESYHPLDRPPNVSKTSTPEELGEYLRRAGFGDVVTRGEPNVLWASAFGVKPSPTT